MNYLEYYDIYCSYKKAKRDLFEIQNNIADAISSLLSITSQLKDDVISNSNVNDKIATLTAKKIELESQQELARDLLNVRTEQKNKAEIELRESINLKDIIYVKYYIDHKQPKEISKSLNFAKSYIYNLLNEIKFNIYQYDKKHKKK